MRHVSDGELHAYLDGALDLLPEGRGAEIREHLAVCSVCGERLQDEKKVRDQAQDLLSAAAPLPVDLPSFEALRAQADAREENESRFSSPILKKTRNRPPLRGLPLAWAATVVLALGVGWMGSEMWRSLPDSSSSLPGEAELDAIRRGPPPQAVPGAGRASVEGRPAGQEQTPPSTPVEEEQPSTRLREEARLKADESPVPASLAGELARPRPATPVREVDTALRQEVQALNEAAARGDSPAAAHGEDRVLEGNPLSTYPQVSSLTVPGLKFLSAQFEEWVPGERALHIRQLLSMGDTLELRYLGMLMGADPAREGEGAMGVAGRGERPLSPSVLAASLPPGWNQVVMEWGSQGWLVARAPLSEDAIRGLLRTIR